MRIIANRTLYNPREYGRVEAGQSFTVRDSLGAQLIRQGSARPADLPRVVYETKIVRPAAPEVSAREPFRHLPVLDDGDPPAMAAVRNSVMAAADVPAQRVPDRRKRRATKRAG